MKFRVSWCCHFG